MRNHYPTFEIRAIFFFKEREAGQNDRMQL
jgi:hypothetical protein